MLPGRLSSVGIQGKGQESLQSLLFDAGSHIELIIQILWLLIKYWYPNKELSRYTNKDVPMQRHSWPNVNTSLGVTSIKLHYFQETRAS